MHDNYKAPVPVIYKNRWALLGASKKGNKYLDDYEYRNIKTDGRMCIDCWIRMKGDDKYHNSSPPK